MKIKVIKSIFFTILFFILLVFVFTISRGDTFVNYGFSYAISIGEIPYKDFNMVISPFAPFIYSIGLLLFNNIIAFYLEQAILITIMFYYVYKMLGNKTILYLFVLLLPYPIAMVSVLYPGYNYLLLFLFIMFIYIYKSNNKYKDYILGIILGLIFCTKQTVGVVLFVPTLIYIFNNRSRFIKMFIGYIIPILILLLYLIITGSLKYYINLCILGLFDFGKSNIQIYYYYLILFIISIIYVIYRIINDRKNILLYYILLFSIVVLPIIDYYHVCLFLSIVFFILIDSIKWNSMYNKYIIVLIICITGIWSYISYSWLDNISVSNREHFYLVINSKRYDNNSKRLIKYLDSLDKDVIYFMRGSENYYYKIIHNKKLDYFDLPNNGNYGYNGVSLMKNKINNINNSYFILDRELVNDNSPYQQYIKELGKYVINNSKKIKSIGVYDIYYKK